ncbi:MAG: T9SS type A sorting domain-containing protein, partial [Bacteroidetes bacterium]|nr:T9SS type A sorting domain-containing protein [Bacteroidota bacterium]
SSNPGGAAYQWFLNGSPIAGATNGTFNATVDYIGNVSVKVTDVNGCVNTSSAVTVKGTPNTVLFIYPSPTTGQFSVRYYSEASTTPLVRQVNVYDSKGSRVISKTFSIATQYQSLDIDLSKYSAGIYRVELLDRSGNRIKTGSVIKL